MVKGRMHWTQTFFTDLYRRVGLEDKLDFGPIEAKAVKKALKLRKGNKVLDICCGIGRHAVPLAEMGLRVTGLDYNASYLRRARALARRAGVEVRFIKGDMREIDFDSEFNAVVNLFTSFGYYDDETNQRILESIARALKPRGHLMIDVMNKDWLMANYQKWRVTESKDCILLNDHEFDPLRSRMKSRWRCIKGDKVIEMGEFELRLYSAPELGQSIEAAGMEVVDVYGGLELEPFCRESRRLVMVGRKAS